MKEFFASLLAMKIFFTSLFVLFLLVCEAYSLIRLIKFFENKHDDLFKSFYILSGMFLIWSFVVLVFTFLG